ncbi:hypothetical protein [Frankia sp. CcI49]|uniref:hypothetical protein n=1 Tax=Frankia sp. CcI49 TaxID=1745382 RepID=UPI001F5185F3|nr:hypothetical protein [Frankia sp. CcI49]
MLRVSSRSRLIHLTLSGMTVALCGLPFREQIPSDQPGPTAPVCGRCSRTAALHPLDRDPPGYDLTVTSTRPGQVTAADSAGRTISTADTIGLARFHAWDHAHTTALATARLRRDRRRMGPADHEAWRVLLAIPAGRWRPAGTIHTRTDGFLADLDYADAHSQQRFHSRHQARRWIIEHRVVHGWPHSGWFVLDGARLLRRTSSRHAATRWLRGYHATFTGLHATAIRPAGPDAYQHHYPDGSVFTVARATHAADHGIGLSTAPRYPYDDLPFDEGPTPTLSGTP